ncbi:hypothetical protein [Streptomyces sp. ScaeMP-e48]|uniref:hypothetical protein n=1 Tax=Streptomyces sp. ScaeMP-e48 TaxID=1100823 RepID=UPI0015D4ECF4|nr:hypothetical protein [Streptomyces sp. ScaeMP-e48]
MADDRSGRVRYGAIQADDSKIGRTMSALTAQLDDGQLALMTTMAEPYLKKGQWPVWHYVEAQLDRQGLDAASVLKSLPSVGSPLIGQRSYGLAWYDRNQLADDSRPVLTVAAGLHVPQLERVFGDHFITILQYLIKHQQAMTPSPDKVEKAYVTSDDTRRDFSAATPEFLGALPGIFRHEPVLRSGHSTWGTSTGWRFELNRELAKYRNVSNLSEYVSKVTEILLEEQLLFEATHSVTQYAQNIIVGASEGLAPTASPTVRFPVYVNADLIEELEQKQGQTTWSLDKLLQLLRELNDCYAEDHVYACHALVRAVIDHVPPILGANSFESAVSNYKWTRTDKKYMTRLLEFKNQADDVLHRRIRPSKDVIAMHDLLPFGAYLNALLRECIDKL